LTFWILLTDLISSCNIFIVLSAFETDSAVWLWWCNKFFLSSVSPRFIPSISDLLASRMHCWWRLMSIWRRFTWIASFTFNKRTKETKFVRITTKDIQFSSVKVCTNYNNVQSFTKKWCTISSVCWQSVATYNTIWIEMLRSWHFSIYDYKIISKAHGYSQYNGG